MFLENLYETLAFQENAKQFIFTITNFVFTRTKFRKRMKVKHFLEIYFGKLQEIHKYSPKPLPLKYLN